MKANVLIVTYYFPPIAGIGVQRTLKYIKYLPEYNYNPIVFTVKNGHTYAFDSDLLKQLPEDIKIYRTNSGETIFLRNAIDKTVEALNKCFVIHKNLKPKQNNVVEDIDSIDKPKSKNIKEKLFDFIDNNFFIPDSKIRWYKHAIKGTRNVFKNEKIDIIYSSSYPYTVHLIALKIKKKTKLPWVADFRDPWVGNEFMTQSHSERRKKKEAKLENEVIKYADKIIMVTEPICEMYKKRYPSYADKFYTITNGFDIDDFINIEPQKEDKFILNYSGTLSYGENPETLIKALEKLSLEDKEFSNNFILRIIGNIVPEYKKLFNESNINENVVFISYMKYKDCLKKMKGANINLLLLPDKKVSNGIYTGKIFDYIGSEKPILAILPVEGVAAQLINNKEIGAAYNHGDVEGVATFIKTMYLKWLDGCSNPTNSINKCNEFSRENLTSSLAKIFDDIL